VKDWWRKHKSLIVVLAIILWIFFISWYQDTGQRNPIQKVIDNITQSK
jgi:uncharacterized protein YggT (Ycf19 family)